MGLCMCVVVYMSIVQGELSELSVKFELDLHNLGHSDYDPQV